MREKQVRGAMNQPPLLYSRRYYGFICSGGLEPSAAPNPPEASAERGVKWGFRSLGYRHLVRVVAADWIEVAPRCTPIVHLYILI